MLVVDRAAGANNDWKTRDSNAPEGPAAASVRHFVKDSRKEISDKHTRAGESKHVYTLRATNTPQMGTVGFGVPAGLTCSSWFFS